MFPVPNAELSLAAAKAARRDEFAKAVAAGMTTTWDDADHAPEHARRIVQITDALIAHLDATSPKAE